MKFCANAKLLIIKIMKFYACAKQLIIMAMCF
jgi:hypothetical protein